MSQVVLLSVCIVYPNDTSSAKAETEKNQFSMRFHLFVNAIIILSMNEGEMLDREIHHTFVSYFSRVDAVAAKGKRTYDVLFVVVYWLTVLVLSVNHTEKKPAFYSNSDTKLYTIAFVYFRSDFFSFQIGKRQRL